MAEELEKTKQYKYQSNANLVIQRGGSDIGGIEHALKESVISSKNPISSHIFSTMSSVEEL